MTPACGRFGTLNEFFDKAAALDVTHVENKQPQRSNNSSSNNSGRNRQRNSLPKAANQAIGHPSPSQPTPPVVHPASRDQTDTANQAAEDNGQAYHRQHGSQRKLSKLMVYRQMLTMWIAEPQGELLP
jgi:hypothetical protein